MGESKPAFGDERIARILEGKRVVCAYPFPGGRGEDAPQIGMRALTEAEYDAARVQAHSWLEDLARRHGQDADRLLKMDGEILQREVQRQVLAIACRTPTGDAPFFMSAEQLRKMDSGTTDRLWAIYGDHEESVNPLLSLDEDGVKELKAALKKGLHLTGLVEYEPATLRRFIRTLVSTPET